MNPFTHFTHTGRPKRGAKFARKDKRRGPAIVEVITSPGTLYVRVRNLATGKESEIYDDNFTKRYAPYVETPTGEAIKA